MKQITQIFLEGESDFKSIICPAYIIVVDCSSSFYSALYFGRNDVWNLGYGGSQDIFWLEASHIAGGEVCYK